MKKDFVLTFITEFIIILCMLATYKLADTLFGQKGFTDYSIARRVIAMVQPVLLVGMHITIPRQIAFYIRESRQRSSEIFLSALTILFGTAAVFSFILLIFKKQFTLLLFDDMVYAKFIVPLVLMLAGMTIHSAVYGYYRGMGLMKKANIIQIIMMGIIPLLSIYLAKDLAAFLIITGSLWIILSLFFIAGIISRMQFSFSSVIKNVLATFAHGIQRFPADLGLGALLSLPVIFFTHTFGTTQSGYLAFSISLLSMTGAALKPIGLVMLPHATRLVAEKNYSALNFQVRKMMVYFLLISAAVTIGYELLAPVLISAFLGEGHRELVFISRIVMLSAAGYMFYVFFRSILDAARFRSYNTLNILISLGVLLIFSLPGIFFDVSRMYLLSIFVLSSSLLGILTFLRLKRITSASEGHLQ